MSVPCLTVSPVVEHVSGNTVELEMGSLVPGTHYMVGVQAMREDQKSVSAVTEFTTGRWRNEQMHPCIIIVTEL